MKDKLEKYLLIGVGVVVAVVVIDKLMKRFTVPAIPEGYSKLNMDMVLSKGSTGDEVAELQRILVDNYGASLGLTGVDKNGVDGEFGSMTEKALLNAKGVKEIFLKQILTKKNKMNTKKESTNCFGITYWSWRFLYL